MEHGTDVWSDEVDAKIGDAMDRINSLEKRLSGTKHKSDESDDEEQKCDSDLQSLLRCSITKSTMVFPVVAADGYTYERSAIEDLFAETPSGRVLSFVTGESLANRHLVPNVAVQAVASRYVEKREEQK